MEAETTDFACGVDVTGVAAFECGLPFMRSTSVTKPTCEPVAPVGTPLSATATSPTWGIASGVPYSRQFEAMAAPEGGVPPALLITDAANSPHHSPLLG